VVKSYVKKLVQERDEYSVASHFRDMLDTREPSTAGILAKSSRFISPKCGSEAVLSIGSGIEWMESPEFAGVISVMPHGCMPGGIVAAMAEKFCTIYQKPWISLTYDGFLETNNFARVNNFAEIIKFCGQEAPDELPLLTRT
jgi:predicted nucleotide-binding protein (sugar kinase/HSP70/actin superfamily)